VKQLGQMSGKCTKGVMVDQREVVRLFLENVGEGKGRMVGRDVGERKRDRGR
jgi:hypothetical protein